uniref:N-acetyltransferase domain-containing protein n=1 Tax=Pseudomonas phage HRDY3 TaxID=3236930 RepID=A0AB39CDI8_9VIRU
MHYQVHQGSDLPKLAQKLLDQKVFEESGELQTVWERVAKTGRNVGRKVLIVTARSLDKNPESPNNPMWRIHGALLYEINRSHMQVYVRPEKRRQGVAAGLLSRLRDFENYDSRVISAEAGYPGSLEFFKKHLVYVPDHSFTQDELLQVNGEMYRAGKLPKVPQPYYVDAVQEIIKRRKRAFLQLVLKAKREGKI